MILICESIKGKIFMDNLFRYDSKFWNILDKITDMVVLNFLFIVSSIPIVTIGASLSAIYSVSLKKVENKDVYVVKEFIKNFKENFKVSTIVWILMMLVGFVLLLDFHISNLLSNKALSIMLQFISTLIGIVYLFSLIYIFPIISKFDNTIKNTFINSVFMSIQSLPYTIIMLITNILGIALIVLLKNHYGYILFFYIVIGFGIISYINSIFFNKIFDKYMK